MSTIELLKEQIERAAAGEEANYPRWVRVNAVKSSLENQLETTFAKFSRAESVKDVVSKTGKHIYIDPNVPNLIAITSGTDLTKSEAYTTGKIILQDKASCFPAYLLDPRAEDGDVIDACAAPGNKTTHLAAILHTHQPEFESPPQTIFAFEKDSRRAQILDKMTTIAGSKKMTRIGFGQDFLQVDPLADKYKAVGALLLDPSCSGSGIVGRDSMPELFLPDAPTGTGKSATGKSNKRKRKHEEIHEPSPKVLIDDDGNETVMRSEKDLEARLEALAAFQLTLLLHAFRFPSAKKITYSTCSIHMQENEGVVMQALQSDIAQKRGWHILPRADQVSGMREWPVRGLTEACGGDAEVADACIRSYKDDGRGVMGFFVAGFVRLGAQDAALPEDNEGPYLRDEDGKIIRDLVGMPLLRSTGVPVTLNPRLEADFLDGEEQEEQSEEEAEEDSGSSGDEGPASANNTHTSSHRSNSKIQILDSKTRRDVGAQTMDVHVEEYEYQVEDKDEDEWQGFGD